MQVEGSRIVSSQGSGVRLPTARRRRACERERIRAQDKNEEAIGAFAR